MVERQMPNQGPGFDPHVGCCVVTFKTAHDIYSKSIG